MSSEDDATDCEYYNQCLGFEEDSTVTALGIGVLIVVVFLFIASLCHRHSSMEHLLHVTSKYYLYFYAVCGINFALIIISVQFFNYTIAYSQISIGAILILTAMSTQLINLIGCKYYRSYLCMKKISLRWLLFFGLSVLVLSTIIGAALLYLSVFDNSRLVKIDFVWFLLFELMVTVIHTSIASFASKLSQLQWLLLMTFTVLYVRSYFNSVYEPFNLFLIYWHPILLCGLSVASVFGLSPFIELQYICIGIFSCFIAMFDLVTDINVIYVWINNGHFIWASFQTLFIVSGTLFSAYYVKDYYGFAMARDEPIKTQSVSAQRKDDESEFNDVNSVSTYQITRVTTDYMEYIPSKKMQTMGQLCTCIGLGRLWHGFLGWDSERNKDMMISHKILKIWEMIFESMPTLVLQFYILLLTDGNWDNWDLSVLLSITGLSVCVYIDLFPVNR